MNYDLCVIGGGPAGMAAALSAHELGIEKILIIERDHELGGILNQCIHSGFGLTTFREELTGPEYAERYIRMTEASGIDCSLNTMVTDIKGADEEGFCSITAMNGENGLFRIRSRAVILAMGCREKSRGALNIPGYRPAGIYSAGTAQRYVNIDGLLPGKKIVILGSGDIGLIMARRMVLEGAKVQCVAEIAPYSGGLRRNIVQCLDDYEIPLLFRHTVTKIHGKKRVSGVTISEVDENYSPVPGTEKEFECDTLLLSVGLIPENELSKAAGAKMDPVTQGPVVNERLETTAEGIFACGNVLHVHDLVDNVTKESVQAGRFAAEYILNGKKAWGEAKRPPIPKKEKNTIPEDLDRKRQVICIRCPNGCLVTADRKEDGGFEVSGNLCPKGREYIINEFTDPRRNISSIIRVENGRGPVVSCKTSSEIPKGKIGEVMKEVRLARAKAPVKVGDVLLKNVADTGVDMIATADMEEG
ncbi:MAG: FAD-dependent oxidoreductase [Lachnospiraceae bacterium]|nr:FAD-dependent oxidoreductase [Lachnospiraceae bacterium]